MQLTLEQYETIEFRTKLEHQGVKMVFATPNLHTQGRVQSIFQKEPCTLEWIAGFEPDDVLLDCGANVGMYTIWAAATRGSQVFAFEPESKNYALLNRNIELNRVVDRVRAYCLGLSDERGLSELHMADLRAGGSCHSLGEALDYKHDPLDVKFVQGSVADTIDHLVSSGEMPVPNHIKIDVDGFEPKVIGGARETLRDPSVRSLLIEINPNLADHREMAEALRRLGFAYDPAQVKRAERQEGIFKGVAEHVFKR